MPYLRLISIMLSMYSRARSSRVACFVFILKLLPKAFDDQIRKSRVPQLFTKLLSSKAFPQCLICNQGNDNAFGNIVGAKRETRHCHVVKCERIRARGDFFECETIVIEKVHQARIPERQLHISRQTHSSSFIVHKVAMTRAASCARNSPPA